jgi:hypothetical protein
VTSKFEKCGKNGQDDLCTCGIYIRVNDSNPSYAFIDKCSRDPFNNNRFKYFDANLTVASLNDNHPLIECDSLAENMNEIDWESLALDRNFFKCIQLKSSSMSNRNTYVVKFNLLLKLFKKSPINLLVKIIFKVKCSDQF